MTDDGLMDQKEQMLQETGGEFVVTVYGLPRAVQVWLFHNEPKDKVQAAFEFVGAAFRGRDLGYTLGDANLVTVAMALGIRFAKVMPSLANFDMAWKPERISFIRDVLVPKQDA